MDLLCRLFQLDRGFFVLLLCVVTSIGLSAQNTNDTVVVDVGASTTAMRYNSLLWKIEGENLKAPSFLYGTMHSRNKAVHQLGDSVLVKLNDCEALSLEIVTEGLNQMDMMKSLIASMMMKDTTLQDLYEDKSDYKKVKKHVRDRLGLLGMLINVDTCKPIYLSTIISDLNTEIQKDDAKLPLDLYLQEVGKAKGKTLISLESVDEQIAALNMMPLKIQADMLLEQIENEGQEDEMGDKMIDFYVAQDLDSLLSLYYGQQDAVTEAFDDALVVQRNINMANRMDTMMQSQPTFTAVGALHLPGEKGVLNLLQKKGYTVSPVYSMHPNNKPKPRLATQKTNDATTTASIPDGWVWFESSTTKFMLALPKEPTLNEMPDGKIKYSMTDDDGLNYSLTLIETNKKMTPTLIANPKDKLTFIQQEKIIYQNEAAEVGLYKLQQKNRSETYARYMVTQKGNLMYTLKVTGTQKSMYADAVNAFFKSFKMLD